MINISKPVIKEAMEKYYGLNNILISPIKETKVRSLFKIDAQGQSFVLRVYSGIRKKQPEHIEKDAAILNFLGKNNFPSPGLVSTVNNKGYCRLNDHYALLTSFTSGHHPELTASAMAKAGDMAAKLHILIADRYPYKSSWNLKREKHIIREYLTEIGQRQDRLGQKSLEIMTKKVIKAMADLPDLVDLPETIIHTDIHPHNIIETEDGNFVLLDWDDAGKGVAALDLAFTLSQVCLRFADKDSLEPIWREDLAKPFLKSYQKIRRLTPAEKNKLIYAMQFCALAYVIHYWSDRVDEQNWARYEWELHSHYKPLLRLF